MVMGKRTAFIVGSGGWRFVAGAAAISPFGTCLGTMLGTVVR